MALWCISPEWSGWSIPSTSTKEWKRKIIPSGHSNPKTTRRTTSKTREIACSTAWVCTPWEQGPTGQEWACRPFFTVEKVYQWWVSKRIVWRCIRGKLRYRKNIKLLFSKGINSMWRALKKNKYSWIIYHQKFPETEVNFATVEPISAKDTVSTFSKIAPNAIN